MFKEREIRLHLLWEEDQKIGGQVLCHHRKGGIGIPPPELEGLQQVETSEKDAEKCVQNDLVYNKEKPLCVNVHLIPCTTWV